MKKTINITNDEVTDLTYIHTLINNTSMVSLKKNHYRPNSLLHHAQINY